MHKRLGSVSEEKEDEPEHLLTPPSQIAQDDQAGFLTDEKASLPPLKTHSKPTVETVLKRIKSQVTIFISTTNLPIECRLSASVFQTMAVSSVKKISHYLISARIYDHLYNS